MNPFQAGSRVVIKDAYAAELSGDPAAGLVVKVCGPRKVKVLWTDGRVVSHDPFSPYMRRFKVDSK